jgi:hypothetical protein
LTLAMSAQRAKYGSDRTIRPIKAITTNHGERVAACAPGACRSSHPEKR